MSELVSALPVRDPQEQVSSQKDGTLINQSEDFKSKLDDIEKILVFLK
jgi:hypothetical protein